MFGLRSERTGLDRWEDDFDVELLPWLETWLRLFRAGEILLWMDAGTGGIKIGKPIVGVYEAS